MIVTGEQVYIYKYNGTYKGILVMTIKWRDRCNRVITIFGLTKEQNRYWKFILIQYINDNIGKTKTLMYFPISYKESYFWNQNSKYVEQGTRVGLESKKNTLLSLWKLKI